MGIKGLLKGVAILAAGIVGMTLSRNLVVPRLYGSGALSKWPKIETFVGDALNIVVTVLFLVVGAKISGRFLGHGGPGVSAHVTGGGK